MGRCYEMDLLLRRIRQEVEAADRSIPKSRSEGNGGPCPK